MVIDLQTLAAIAAAEAPYHAMPVAPLRLGVRTLDTDSRPAIAAVVNLSPDSTYRTSIAPDTDSAVRRARIAIAEGADFVDLGAESTSQHAGRADVEQQLSMLGPVIERLTAEGIASSVESYFPEVIERLVGAGARLINLTGSRDDDEVFRIAARSGATLILCYAPGSDVRQPASLPGGSRGMDAVVANLRPRVGRALDLGVRSLVVDPGIGFSYANLRDPMARIESQSQYLLLGGRLRQLGFPVLQSLPNAFTIFQEHYRAAEGYFAVLALLGRAGVLRVHEVGQVRAVSSALRVRVGGDAP